MLFVAAFGHFLVGHCELHTDALGLYCSRVDAAWPLQGFRAGHAAVVALLAVVTAIAMLDCNSKFVAHNTPCCSHGA